MLAIINEKKREISFLKEQWKSRVTPTSTTLRNSRSADSHDCDHETVCQWCGGGNVTGCPRTTRSRKEVILTLIRLPLTREYLGRRLPIRLGTSRGRFRCEGEARSPMQDLRRSPVQSVSRRWHRMVVQTLPT